MIKKWDTDNTDFIRKTEEAFEEWGEFKGLAFWFWEETGTHHSPGVQPADLIEILEHDFDVIVLSRGQLGRLNVSAETEGMLRERETHYHVKKTKEAVQLFNELAGQGKRVGGLFHSTC